MAKNLKRNALRAAARADVFEAGMASGRGEAEDILYELSLSSDIPDEATEHLRNARLYIADIQGYLFERRLRADITTEAD